MSLNLSLAIIECLKERLGEKLTARQIAEKIFEKFPDECQEKRARSKGSYIRSDNDLIQQIAREIGSRRPGLQKRYAELKITEGRPRKYYYSEESDDAEVMAAENTAITPTTGIADAKPSEHDLYPMLSLYLQEEFGVYSKRIDEKRSSKKRGPHGNHWLHPDVIGMEDLGTDWHLEVRDCVKHYSDKRTKLWSLEVKLLINRSNVRECYFQAVSNSSWANFGYLVAAEIGGHDTLQELRLLFAAHGIGVINLNVEDPSESQVLIPARERDTIDWGMVNRLSTENSDFLGYVKLVKQFYQTGEVRPKDWDIQEIED